MIFLKYNLNVNKSIVLNQLSYKSIPSSLNYFLIQQLITNKQFKNLLEITSHFGQMKKHLLNKNSNQKVQPCDGMESNGKQHARFPSNFKAYLLQEYTFLNQYELLDSPLNSQTQFLARIKDTQQLVKFVKRQFIATNTPKGLSLYKRFQAMYSLYKKGLILADNMFILQEASNLFYYYVIQPYLSASNKDPSFITLQQYLYDNRTSKLSFEAKRSLILKCKNLLDNLSFQNQVYCGLNTQNIIIDDQLEVFLLPFSLQPILNNRPYERSYYPKQILQILKSSSIKQIPKSMHKWDIWSFGCVSIQILLYLTPFFMSTSVQKQIKDIDKDVKKIFQDFRNWCTNLQEGHSLGNCESSRSIEQQLISQLQDSKKILNFLLNVFNGDQSKRSLSFDYLYDQQGQDCQKYERKSSSRFKRSVRRMISKHKTGSNQKLSIINKRVDNYYSFNPCSKWPDNKKEQLFKQLNICPVRKAELASNLNQLYSFELKFLSISVHNSAKELPAGKSAQTLNQSIEQINLLINFSSGQNFQFFLNISKQIHKQQGSGEQWHRPISKKITFPNKTQQFIDQLLEGDIQIQVQINDSPRDGTYISAGKSLIYVNLSSLAIKNQEGNRIWKKPIKGSYGNQNKNLVNCKIKLQARIQGGLQHIQGDGGNLDQIKGINKLSPQSQMQKLQQKTKNDKLSPLFFKQQSELYAKLTQTYQQPQKTEELTNVSIRSRKSSISKFSFINSQLQQISKYWKQKATVSSQNDQKMTLKASKYNPNERRNIRDYQDSKNIRQMSIKGMQGKQNRGYTQISRKLKSLLVG